MTTRSEIYARHRDFGAVGFAFLILIILFSGCEADETSPTTMSEIQTSTTVPVAGQDGKDADPVNNIDAPNATSELSKYKSETSDCITALAWLAVSHRHEHTVTVDRSYPLPPDPSRVTGVDVRGRHPILKKNFTGDTVGNLLDEYCLGLFNKELIEAFTTN